MSRKKLILIFTSIASITIIFIILGFQFQKTESEKRTGLTEVYDVSINETIAYAAYHDGKQALYVKTTDTENLVIELDEDEEFTSVAFTPDGTHLAYAVSIGDVEKRLNSSVHIVDIRSFDSKLLFETNTLMTEITFDPKDENRLFYLNAQTFENYSPIARPNPHEIDVFSYDLMADKSVQHTTMANYSLSSLQVSSLKDAVYVQMSDIDEHSTADEIFEMKFNIYEISLNEPEKRIAITDIKREADIYDFAILPNETGIVFQSVSNINSGGTFEYELYYYDWKEDKEVRLTDLQNYAARPVLANKGEKVYFLVDHNFAKSHYPNYELFKMDIDGNHIEEVNLEHN